MKLLPLLATVLVSTPAVAGLESRYQQQESSDKVGYERCINMYNSSPDWIGYKGARYYKSGTFVWKVNLNPPKLNSWDRDYCETERVNLNWEMSSIHRHNGTPGVIKLVSEGNDLVVYLESPESKRVSRTVIAKRPGTSSKVYSNGFMGFFNTRDQRWYRK